MGCSPPGSSVCGILQARILQWVAIVGTGLRPAFYCVLSTPKNISSSSKGFSTLKPLVTPEAGWLLPDCFPKRFSTIFLVAQPVFAGQQVSPPEILSSSFCLLLPSRSIQISPPGSLRAGNERRENKRTGSDSP